MAHLGRHLVSRTFSCPGSILDGCSRCIVNWDLRESMTEAVREVILGAPRNVTEEAGPRIISDHAPQFVGEDFKEK